MQITVFMAGFMARFALPVKGGEERSSGNGIIFLVNRLQQPTSLKPISALLKFVRHFRSTNLA
uniref:Uncharacterized protein n=1 Tax=Rhizobium leguminosarum TaxID=384 RepID=A0A179B9W3_RHILE|nr:hypothetical protein A4U53_09900 [Rhizobium leguminosarum]